MLLVPLVITSSTIIVYSKNYCYNAVLPFSTTSHCYYLLLLLTAVTDCNHVLPLLFLETTHCHSLIYYVVPSFTLTTYCYYEQRLFTTIISCYCVVLWFLSCHHLLLLFAATADCNSVLQVTDAVYCYYLLQLCNCIL